MLTIKSKSFVNSGSSNISRLEVETVENSGVIGADFAIIKESIINTGELYASLIAFLGNDIKNHGEISTHTFLAPNFTTYIHDGKFHAHNLIVTQSCASNFDKSEYDNLFIIQDHIDPWTLNDCITYYNDNYDQF